ncbi:MAG: ABC transporter permease [Myxococcota bacterium]
MDDLFAVVEQVIRIAMPYALAAAGGVVCERSGVVNLALEGLLIAGAFSAVVFAHLAPSVGPYGAIAFGIAAGMALASVHAFMTVNLRADHITSGIALNLLADGLSRFGLHAIFHSASNSARVQTFAEGTTLWTSPLTWLSLLAIAGVAWWFSKTVAGIRITAAGDHPEAAESLGIRVARVRWQAVLVSGALAGLAGVWLAFEQHQFTAGMTGGRGFVAVSAVIFGGWRILPAALAAVAFGAGEAAQIQIQAAGTALPTQLVQTLPYLLTLTALVLVAKRARAPGALGATDR